MKKNDKIKIIETAIEAEKETLGTYIKSAIKVSNIVGKNLCLLPANRNSITKKGSKTSRNAARTAGLIAGIGAMGTGRRARCFQRFVPNVGLKPRCLLNR